MDQNINFRDCFKLIDDIAASPYIKYECWNDPNVMFFELRFKVSSVSGLIFEKFSIELEKDIDTGMRKLEEYVNDHQGDEAKSALQIVLKGLNRCKSRVNTVTSKAGFEYYYFIRANFDDGSDNVPFTDRIREMKEKGYEENASDTEKYEINYLHRANCEYVKAYVDCLDSLEFQINNLNTIRISKSALPDSMSKKYELSFGHGIDSKDLVYLFNILSRIDFFILGEQDKEKLYQLIANLYRPKSGEKTNKHSNVKNTWTNLGGNRITKKFCQDFKDKVLKEIEIVVNGDISTHYDFSRKRKNS